MVEDKEVGVKEKEESEVFESEVWALFMCVGSLQPLYDSAMSVVVGP